MATYQLSIHDGFGTQQNFEADPEDLTINDAVDGTEVKVHANGITPSFQAHIPENVPYTIRTVED
ncbi:hypothetical protein [Natrinema salsiterrestre]|uniref:Uncharacterized protein n=1 Tax=Natrinema salsiterrestre TaxID=2950540 RepID=A0A9Q4L1X0_9EURY|nr:hypothetical protein [Natrinema salsiterrestre]MDF9748373.1 hypothetical protein [Natrinema salsiterrestre]